METVQYAYSTRDEAVRDQVVGEDKLIPEKILPQSAKDIHLKFNTDTNEVWLTFRYSLIESFPTANWCHKITEKELVYPRQNRDRWWPKALSESGNPSHKSTTVYEYFQCKKGGNMASDRNGTAYYWRK
jgi:hypothetical protein